MSDLNTKLTTLIQWIRDNGGYIHPNLERRIDNNGVAGIYTTADIPANESLIRVPNKLCITDKTHHSPNWEIRIKTIYSILKELQTRDSFYANVLTTMPELEEYQKSHPFLSMTDEEKTRAEGYCVIYKSFRESYEANYRDVYKLIRDFDPKCTDEEILRAYMLVVTRSWPGVYAPYMDMFNHSIQYGAVNTVRNDSQELYTAVAYPANSQIYISYGIKDVLSLAYDYAFYDNEDFSIAIPRHLQYIADTPLKFAVAKHLMEYGLTAELDVNKNLICYYKDLSIFCKYDNFIGFSDHGISQQTWNLFAMMAIDNFKELLEWRGDDSYTKELLANHLKNMLTSVNPLVNVGDYENGSYAYKTLIKAAKKRTEILQNCLSWLSGELRGTYGSPEPSLPEGHQ